MGNIPMYRDWLIKMLNVYDLVLDLHYFSQPGRGLYIKT